MRQGRCDLSSQEVDPASGTLVPIPWWALTAGSSVLGGSKPGLPAG